ncbi:MAG: TIGR02587 family membrane protein [Thermomicrobiales bacterium]
MAAFGTSEMWGRETDDLLRGVTGGFLVGTPLFFTMEAWWLGQTITMSRALAIIALSYVLNLAFVLFTGFRIREAGSHRPYGDAVEATALAIVAAAITLTLIHQITLDQPLNVVIGRIAVGALPVSLGVSIANHILAPRESRTGSPDEGNEEQADIVQGVVIDFGAAFAGALFLSLNIAVTDETIMLATEVPVLLLPAIILFSLLLSHAIVFEAGFGGQTRRLRTPGPFQRPITETVAAYLVSLATRVLTLWLFDVIKPGGDWYVTFAQIVILALPASIGAAAGRLAV